MGPSNPPTARKTTGPRSKAARSRTAGNLPTLISNTDPFHVLDDLSIREIFLLLSPIDIVRCDAVSRFWRATVEFHLTNSVIRRDFPYAWETGRITDTGRSGEKVGEFKRIAYEDWVLRHGQAVWARHFPCVNMSTVAGDYVVWHERGQGYLQWQILSGKGKNGREVGETKMLHLFELIEPARSITVDSLHVNENGLLHAKLWVLDSTYCSETAIGTYLARYTFSLKVPHSD
ncbi:MAG: hypothetical protein M1840_008923 [Geoglossum simile]|nr:MAG: hypothetical protein M1840_008923 [Geoglossum simile]